MHDDRVDDAKETFGMMDDDALTSMEAFSDLLMNDPVVRAIFELGRERSWDREQTLRACVVALTKEKTDLQVQVLNLLRYQR